MELLYSLSIGLKKLLSSVESRLPLTADARCSRGQVLPLTIPENFTVTAHSGAMLTRANSVWFVREGTLCGAQVIEVDLNFRPDGTPVMRHNAPKSNSSGVPFEKALAAAARSNTVLLNIDIKSCANLPEVLRLLQKYLLTKRAFFTGVHGDFIAAVRRDCPEIPYYLNHWSTPDFKGTQGEIDEKVRQVLECGAMGINMNSGNLSRELCEAMHKNGLLVSVWTINSRADMYKMLALSPDNITTKYPLRLLRLIESQRKGTIK